MGGCGAGGRWRGGTAQEVVRLPDTVVLPIWMHQTPCAVPRTLTALGSSVRATLLINLSGLPAPPRSPPPSLLNRSLSGMAAARLRNPLPLVAVKGCPTAQAPAISNFSD